MLLKPGFSFVPLPPIETPEPTAAPAFELRPRPQADLPYQSLPSFHAHSRNRSQSRFVSLFRTRLVRCPACPAHGSLRTQPNRTASTPFGDRSLADLQDRIVSLSSTSRPIRPPSIRFRAQFQTAGFCRQTCRCSALPISIRSQTSM